MKNKKVFFLFMFLPLVVVCIALAFLPDQIPAHYNFNHQVDRWGSKYESLILPLVTIAFGVFMLKMADFAGKKEIDGSNNQKATLFIGTMVLMIFNFLSFFFLYTSFRKVEDLGTLSMGLDKIIFLALGCMLILIGNRMPKVRQNHILGLRTKWSLKDGETWKKSQRVGGILAILAGVLLICMSFLFEHRTLLFLNGMILIVFILLSYYATYKIYNKH